MLPLLALALPLVNKVSNTLGDMTRMLTGDIQRSAPPISKNITINSTQIHNKISF